VVEVPTSALMRHNVTMRQIAMPLRRGAGQPGRRCGIGAARVRTGAERRSPDQIAAIVLRRAADGSTLTIGDVAGRGVGPRPVQAFFVGDDPAMTVRVDRSDTGDAIKHAGVRCRPWPTRCN
jgi:hypothetical protein